MQQRQRVGLALGDRVAAHGAGRAPVEAERLEQRVREPARLVRDDAPGQPAASSVVEHRARSRGTGACRSARLLRSTARGSAGAARSNSSPAASGKPSATSRIAPCETTGRMRRGGERLEAVLQRAAGSARRPCRGPCRAACRRGRAAVRRARGIMRRRLRRGRLAKVHQVVHARVGRRGGAVRANGS